MTFRKTINILMIFAAVSAFGVLGTAWPSGSAKAGETNKLQTQNTDRRRLRDGSNCTTEGGFNINGYNNADAPGNTNSGNGNRHGGGGNNSGADKTKVKGISK